MFSQMMLHEYIRLKPTWNSHLAAHSASDMTPAGLEPAIPGSVGRCLIHWATGPLATSLIQLLYIKPRGLPNRQRMATYGALS